MNKLSSPTRLAHGPRTGIDDAFLSRQATIEDDNELALRSKSFPSIAAYLSFALSSHSCERLCLNYV